MDRVFLDANVLFSAAYLPGSGLRRLWSLTDVQLVTSAFATAEARRNLRLLRPQSVAVFTELLGQVSIMPEALGTPRLPSGVSLPEKDLPILAAAAAARCTHLLTGDAQHFGALYGRRVAGVLVLRPADYLRMRQPRGRGGKQ
ncbi:MAG: DNA-binding protein [Armatimonadota bacterium]